MISVIIPTFNEKNNISELIPHLENCTDSEDLEIIVVDSPFSSDNLASLKGKFNFQYVKAQKGYRSFQLHYGAENAKGEILYFLHADARPPLNFVSHIYSSLAKDYKFGIFAYKFDSDNLLLRMNSFFTKFDGLFSGGGDQSIFMKRSTYNMVGGFNTSLRIMEDFDLFRRCKAKKLNFLIVKDPVLVSARKYENNSWFKVNLMNLRIFVIYLFNGSQEKMIKLNSKLKCNK